ncbi:MAG: Pyrrolo-quinoline quinone [Caulobacteraceae bacterium]|nr:Pyrrolo-quinoline quinone [Caulobacteraceae bacterium]
MTTRRKLGAIAVIALLALGGCSTVSKIGSINPFRGRDHEKARERNASAKAGRIPVIALNDQLKVADALKGQDFLLPPPAPQQDWPVPGGTLEQSVEHVDAAPAFQIAWRRSIGVPESRRHHITAPPIAEGGRIFVMDGAAGVSAHDERTGAQIWRTNIQPKSRRDHEAWGGGLAYADGKVYVSSGFREVVQLDARTGALGWRSRTDAPLHAAPTVADGRVFVADVNDELLAFDTASGLQLWTYQALTEPARILAASSSAVANDTLVTSFASGELVALRAANGNELWNAALARASRTNALSEIRDIPGRPVVYKTDVFAVSHADYFAAVDLRTGSVRWTLPVSAITTPWAAGDVVYVVDQSGQVICVSRDSGQVYWIRDLNAGLKKKKRAYWSSPVLASNRLVTLSSKGEALALNPKTGAPLGSLRLGTGALLGPIAVSGMIYAVTEGGQLVAIR